MNRIFVEIRLFKDRVEDRGGDPLLQAIQRAILENPTEADVIPGSGGIRKMRIADPRRGKGKRGGFRVLYLDLPDRRKTYLLTLYDKGEKEDISPDEKKVMRELVEKLKSAEGGK